MLLLTAKAGDTRKIANLGGEIEIRIISIQNGHVLFGVRTQKEQMQVDTSDCIFLKKQAD